MERKKKGQQYFKADSYSRKINTLIKTIINSMGNTVLAAKSLD